MLLSLGGSKKAELNPRTFCLSPLPGVHPKLFADVLPPPQWPDSGFHCSLRFPDPTAPRGQLCSPSPSRLSLPRSRISEGEGQPPPFPHSWALLTGPSQDDTDLGVF